MAGTTFPPNAPTLAGAVSGELQTAPWVPVKAGPAIPSLLRLQHTLHTALPGIAHLHKPPAPAAQSLPTHDMCGTRNIVAHTRLRAAMSHHTRHHTARVVTSHERYTMRAVTSHKGYTAREVTFRKRNTTQDVTWPCRPHTKGTRSTLEGVTAGAPGAPQPADSSSSRHS